MDIQHQADEAEGGQDIQEDDSAPSVTEPSTFINPYRISPLDIPELLERIFTYVDTTTLVTSVPLVCRQWFLVNRNRSNRVFEWVNSFSDPNVDKDLQRLQKADTLCCRLCRRWLPPAAMEIDEKLWNAVRGNHMARVIAQRKPLLRRQFQVMFGSDGGGNVLDISNGGGDGSGAVDVQSPELRQLILEGFVTMDLLSDRFMPFLPSLRILKIHATHNSNSVFSVALIMMALPCLEKLHFQHTGAMNALELSGQWIEDYATGRTPLSRVRLRSLVIINAWLPQASLEDFLAISPDLKELKLMLLQYPYKSGPFYDPARLLCHLQKLSLDLRAFHFSDRSSLSNPNLERELNFGLCPQATDWTFRGTQFTPDIIRSLDRLPNVLTTLELLGECKYLHDYLCESPFLLHLKAPLTDMPIRNLDLHMNGGDTGLVSESVLPPSRIWACQGLRTLQLLLRGCGGSTGSSFSSPSPSLRNNNTNKNSLIVFGYISRVCPLLQVLEIYGPEVQMDDHIDPSTHRINLDLASGFCLLVRLRHLRRLQIGASDPHKPTDLGLKSVDVDWMLPSGYTEQKRQERQVVIDGLEEIIQEDIRNHAAGVSYIPQVSEVDNRPVSIPGVEAELAQQLSHLGHWMDVKVMLEEMNAATEGYVCWPELEEVSIYYQRYRGLSLEREVDRLLSPVPVKVEWSRSPLKTLPGLPITFTATVTGIAESD
ncbi:hypothetical protein BGX29_008692 [Mortierella sp. GBA35]|nr:hypothetical protein BGX29_008692 [Mortierella sp. GBA35]